MKSRLGPFTGGQLTAIIITLALVIGIPATAFATASLTNVGITDVTGTKHAIVDKNGALLTRDGGVPNGAFSVSSVVFTSTSVKLPACATSTCHYAITDVIVNQNNADNLDITMQVRLRLPVSGVCTVNSGTQLASVLPANYFLPKENSDFRFETPILAAGNPVCIEFSMAPFRSGQSLAYTVSGYRLTN